MDNHGEVVIWLAVGVLRGGNYEIEALSLEALATDLGHNGLGRALEVEKTSEQRAGAFGMELLGAVIVPVVVEAARQFWVTYQTELSKKLGEAAADLTFAKLKKWFNTALSEEQKEVSQKLADTIRKVGKERQLRQEDIDALVVAAIPETLSQQLS
jgi:hypothetical protein